MRKTFLVTYLAIAPARTFLAVWLAGVAFSGTMIAHECLPGPNYASRVPYWTSTVVFIGTAAESESHSDYSVARLTVEKAYRGDLENTAKIFSHQSYFVVGQRYFVYASRNAAGNLWITFPCGDTKPLESAEDDIAYAEDIAAGKLGTRIYGWVSQFPIGPVVGIDVKIRSKKNLFSTKTDEKGRYIFKDIPSGSYTVEINPPKGLRNMFPKSDLAIIDASPVILPDSPAPRTPGTLILAEPRPTRWANRNFTFSDQGSIEGRVSDQHGGVPSQQFLSLIPIDEKGRVNAGDTAAHVYTDRQTGVFLFDRVPPGKYLLAINPLDCHSDRNPEFGRSFFPGVIQQPDAYVINVDAMQDVKLERNYVVPSPRRERSISGVVLQSDNTPAVGANVFMSNLARKQPSQCFNNVGEVSTDSAGRFSLKGYEGYSYQIRAYTEATAQGQQPLVRHYSAILTVDPGESDGVIRLIIDPVER